MQIKSDPREYQIRSSLDQHQLHLGFSYMKYNDTNLFSDTTEFFRPF